MKKVFWIKKKVPLFIAILIVLTEGLISAQVSANPNDPFYSDALSWEALELIQNLPPLRPYPLPLVKSILETVIETGNKRQSSRAMMHYERIFGRKIHAGVEFYDAVSITDNNADMASISSDNQYQPGLIAYGNVELPYYLSASFNVIPFVTNKEYGSEIIPANERPEYDYADDALKVGPLNQFTEYNATASVGTENIWFQAGLTRSSWGAFPDSIVLGSQAPHTGNLSFCINQSKWNYELSMFVLSASDSFGYGNNPEKFMTMHSLEISFFPWLDFTIYENAVYGPRFDVAYLMPIAPFMAMQQITGFNSDNLQIGVQLEAQLKKGIVWAANIFADDIGFNDLVKLKLNTKLKLAGQTGIKYAPENSIFSLLNADYTLVAPYMYSHSQYEYSDSENEREDRFLGGKYVNYQNYTSNGQSLGSSLMPNSDKIGFSAIMNPLSGLRITFFTSYVRHANVNESLPDEYAERYLRAPADLVLSDGSIFDYPDTGDSLWDAETEEFDEHGYFSYAQHNFMFMNQSTKMYICKVGANADYDLICGEKAKYGKLSFGLGWTFEYIKNNGVQNNMYSGGVLQAGYTAEQASKAISDAKEAWKSNLHDTITNYFTVKMRYVY